MPGATKIEWTDATWNPLVGCSVASPGCTNCYAARQTAGRLSSNRVYSGLAVRPEGGGPAVFTGEIRTLPDRLDQPLRWQRPRRVFVNSMSDLFHPDVPVGFIGSVWATMGLASRHRFQVLTKRPQRMQRMVSVLAEWAATPGGAYGGPIWRDHQLRWNESPVWPLPNVMARHGFDCANRALLSHLWGIMGGCRQQPR